MDQKPQTFANHVKYDPPYHYFLIPVLLLNIILVGYHLFRFPSAGAAWLLVMSVALLVLAGRMRRYATKLQDRVIRVEERLRLSAVLPEPLRSRIGELSDRQLVGLRFASDQELPALVRRALEEKLDRKQIKQAVTNWRPDNSRV
jgi:hypothetical protein